MTDFEFHWKYGDFEINVSHNLSTKLPYIDLVKWVYPDDNKKPYCYSLAYYEWNDEGGELHFVGNRPFEDIAEVDLTPIWKQLWLACKMLQDWYEKERYSWE